MQISVLIAYCHFGSVPFRIVTVVLVFAWTHFDSGRSTFELLRLDSMPYPNTCCSLADTDLRAPAISPFMRLRINNTARNKNIAHFVPCSVSDTSFAYKDDTLGLPEEPRHLPSRSITVPFGSIVARILTLNGYIPILGAGALALSLCA